VAAVQNCMDGTHMANEHIYTAIMLKISLTENTAKTYIIAKTH